MPTPSILERLQPTGCPVPVTGALEGGHVVVDQFSGLVPVAGRVGAYAERDAGAVQPE